MPVKPETILRRVKLLPEYQSKIYLEFKDWLVDEQDNSERNWLNYFKVLVLFSDYIGSKKLEDVTKDDVISFLDKRKKSIEIDPDKKWVVTWNHYLHRLIGFYRWMDNHSKNIDMDDWETPEPVCSIKRKKNKRISSYSPNDVWSIDELLLAVKYCTNIRDKTILTLSWDMAARNHEITKLKLKDIKFKEKYAEATTSWDTKTGMRTTPLIISFSYLRELINNHPFSSSPNAFVILSLITNKPLQPDSIWGITDAIKRRISRMLQNNEIKGKDKEPLSNLIKKPWNPYLIGRHSSLTEKTSMLTDHQLTKYAGWTPNTKRRATYIHMSGKEISDPLLEYHGIKVRKEPKSIRQECSRCDSINTVEASICSNCSFILNTKAWEETKIEEQTKEKEMSFTITSLKKKIEELKNNTITKSELEEKLPILLKKTIERIKDDLQQDGWKPIIAK